MRWALLALLAACAASPSIARATFVPLPPGTPFTNRIGASGALSTLAGVDFWKDGPPPRPYQLLGFLMGPSEPELLSSFGTETLASRVRDAGGDALVLVRVSDLPLQARAALAGIPGAPTIQMWVIKYLPADAKAVAEDDHGQQMTEMAAWTSRQCSDPNSITSMAALTPQERKSVRTEIRKTIARIARAIRSEPGEVRRRTEEMHRLTMQMLDCQEQRQVEAATQAAIRGGVGVEVKWASPSDPAVEGRSIAAAHEILGDGSHCIDVTDVIIIDGEETVSSKRMCRPSGATGYRLARSQQG